MIRVTDLLVGRPTRDTLRRVLRGEGRALVRYRELGSSDRLARATPWNLQKT